VQHFVPHCIRETPLNLTPLRAKASFSVAGSDGPKQSRRGLLRVFLLRTDGIATNGLRVRVGSNNDATINRR